MRVTTVALPALFFALAGAVACDDEDPPPAGVSNGARSGTAGAGARAGASGEGGRGGSGSNEAGSDGGLAGGGDAGSPGAGGRGGGGDSGVAGDAGGGGRSGASGEGGTGGPPYTGIGGEPNLDCPEPGGTPPDSDPICDPEASFGAGSVVPIEGGARGSLLSVTPDELTIAWVELSDVSSTIYVADRSASADDFSAKAEVLMPSAAFEAALSPDGLRLIVVLDGRFTELTRAARSGTFENPSDVAFSQLNAAASNRYLGDPVVSADDATLYYTARGSGVMDTLLVSKRTGSEPWPAGTPLDQCEFDGESSGLRSPSGISTDGLTLFYYDDPRQTARAAWRPALDYPFITFVDVDGAAVQPNAACDRLYFTSDTGEIAFAERE